MGHSLVRDMIYGMLRSDGITVKVVQIIEGQVDSKGLPASSSRELQTRAVKAGERVAREFFKNNTGTFEKYETPFIIDPSSLSFEPRVGDEILAEGQRYRIKDIRRTDKYVWVLNGTAVEGG